MRRLHRSVASSVVFSFVTLAMPAFAQLASTSAGPPAARAVPEQPSAGDWTSIHAACEAGRRAIVATESGHGARHEREQLALRFDGRGVLARPDAGDWTWGLELERYGFGNDAFLAVAPLDETADGARLERRWDERLTEWYVNEARGLEHGFTVHSRPAGATGAFTLELAIRGELRPLVSCDGRDVSFVDAEGDVALRYAGLSVFEAAGGELAASWRVTGNGLRLTVDDRGARYPLTIDPIVQQAFLKASNNDPGDQFGWSVAISGDLAVVGAPFEDSSAAGLNGNQADNSSPDSGAAYIFERVGSSWVQQVYVKAGNSEANDCFGIAVAIDGERVVIGARCEDSSATGVNGNQGDNGTVDSGAAYVFERTGTSWSQTAYLKASNTGANDQFGRSVAVSGNTIVVGALFEESNATGVDGDEANNLAPQSGAVYVFVGSTASWSQQAYLKASNTESYDAFSFSLGVSGDTLVVGAYLEDSNASGMNGNQGNGMQDSGAAYVFERSGTSWSQQAYLKASNTMFDARFGHAVAISSETVVVGSFRESSAGSGVNGSQTVSLQGTHSGAAYVFVRNASSWSQEAYLKARSPHGGDQFGWSVAASGDVIAVGANTESGNSVTLNGPSSGSTVAECGAAFLFTRSGTTWRQTGYLKAATHDKSGDWLGYSVSVSGDTALVGAPREDSSAAQVNGDESDGNSLDSGAAYVFHSDYQFPSFCYGHGLVSPCPCGNDSALFAGEGCMNSQGHGAKLSASGTDSVFNDDLEFFYMQARPNQTGMIIQGASLVELAFKDGILCMGGPTERLEVVFIGSVGAGFSTSAIAAAGNVLPGQTRYYQLWYRDPAISPCGTGSNFSNGVQVVWAF